MAHLLVGAVSPSPFPSLQPCSRVVCSRVDWDRGARCWRSLFRSAARSRRVGSVQSTRPPGAFRLVCSAKPLRHGFGWCNTGSAGATWARLQHGLGGNTGWYNARICDARLVQRAGHPLLGQSQADLLGHRLLSTLGPWPHAQRRTAGPRTQPGRGWRACRNYACSPGIHAF